MPGPGTCRRHCESTQPANTDTCSTCGSARMHNDQKRKEKEEIFKKGWQGAFSNEAVTSRLASRFDCTSATSALANGSASTPSNTPSAGERGREGEVKRKRNT